MDRKIILALVAVLIIFLGADWMLDRSPFTSNRIKVSGNIELSEIQVSFEIPGRVLKRLVDEGDMIKSGQEIAVLDTQSLVQEVALQKAALEGARAFLEEQEHGYLPEEINQAAARVDQTKADFKRQELDYKRQSDLFSKSVISQREYDLSLAAFQIAEAKAKEAEDQLALLKAGFRIEKVEQARAKVAELEQAVALAETKLSYGVVKAPIDGWVLSKNTEPGEVVSAGTSIVSVGNLDDVWLRAYVNERDLGKVKLGQQVDVTTNSYPGKVYKGKIIFISSEAEFTPKNVQTEEERVKLVYRIKVGLANPNQELKPGMPADGEILL